MVPVPDFQNDAAKTFHDQIIQAVVDASPAVNDLKTSDAPAPAPIAAPDFAAFAKFAMQPLVSPKDQVAAGFAPSTTNLSLSAPVGSGSDGELLVDMQSCLDGAQAISDLYARLQSFTEGGLAASVITDPKLAIKAFESDCNHANDAIKKTLAGLLLIESEKIQEFTEDRVGMDLHVGFINKVFDGFPIGEDARTQLDTVLTNVAKAIGQIDFSSEKTSNTINHFLRVTSIMKNNMGTKEAPVMVYKPMLTLIYLKIDQNSFQAATKKWNANYKVTSSSFNMTITTVQTKLNLGLYKANRDIFNGLLTSLTGQSIEVFAAKMKTAITAGA